MTAITEEIFKQDGYINALKEGYDFSDFEKHIEVKEYSLEEVNDLYDLNLSSFNEYEYDSAHFNDGSFIIKGETFYRYWIDEEIIDEDKL